MMKIDHVGVAGFFRGIMPHFVLCGEVACRIQDAIVAGKAGTVPQKSGGAFAAALTDADILVEGYLGMAVLANWEDAAFYGEERAMDRVSAYFPAKAPYTVTLDPIDGTRYFMDGLPLFSIIMTVCRGGRIIGAMCYLPREGRFYVGLGRGRAFTISAGEALRDEAWTKHVLTERSSTVVLIGSKELSNKPALEKAGFKVIHGDSEYHGQPDWRFGSVRLLSGEVAGLVTRNAQLIDAGAFGFIVASAGGKTNGPVYDPETRLAPRLIIGTSPAIHKRIVAALGE